MGYRDRLVARSCFNQQLFIAHKCEYISHKESFSVLLFIIIIITRNIILLFNDAVYVEIM